AGRHRRQRYRGRIHPLADLLDGPVHLGIETRSRRFRTGGRNGDDLHGGIIDHAFHFTIEFVDVLSRQSANVQSRLGFRGNDIGSTPALSIVGTMEVRSIEYTAGSFSAR